MLHTQTQHKKTAYTFIKSRILRIVPIYWLMTSFLLALYLVVPSLFNQKLITPDLVIYSYFFSARFLSGEWPILGVGWTLEFEMLFYLIFGLSLIMKTWRSILLSVGTVLVFIALSGNAIIIEFLFGMVVAYLYNNIKLNNKNGFLIFVIGLILLLFSPIARSYLSNIIPSDISRLIFWGVPSFFIVFGLVYAKQINNRFLMYLGHASYSIYLIQVFTISAFYKFSSLFLSGINNHVIALLCLASSVLAGCLVFSFIEKPMTNKLKHQFL